MVNRDNKKYCEQCGRSIRNGHSLCEKHYQQLKRYGVFLDDNQRDAEDLNQIILYDNYAEIILYDDLFQEEISEKVIIDLDEVENIKNVRWDKKQSCIIGNILGRNVPLANYILDVDNKIEFIDGNFLNCKKENLRVVEKKYKAKKIDKRRKGKIDITSLGTSTIDVTGSCWSIEYDKLDGTRGLILIENGINQGGTVVEDYNANKRMADYIPYERADFMLYSHVHGDHLLLSPAGISRGFHGKAIMTSGMKVLAEKLLLDGSFIHDRNIKELKKGGRKAEPLFTESDTYLFLNKVKEVPSNEMVKLSEEVSIRLVNNSHVLEAYQIEIYIKKPSNHIVKILYTGDLGSKKNFEFQPFLKENEIVRKADIMICESTYGSNSRSFTKQQCIDERKELMDIVDDTIKNKTKCLIPSFSFSRSQCMMCMLYEHLKDSKENFQIIIDSRLTGEINNAYREILQGEDREYWNEVMGFDRFKFITNYKETLEYATKNDGIPRIILSSSGFMEAGHVRTWASQIMSNANNTICFIGYSGVGTLADKIQNSKHGEIMIDGVNCIRRCKIKTFRTFSSHIQQDEIINYFKQISIGDRILIHHGNEDSKHELKRKATEELRKIGKTTKIVVVEKGCDTFKI